MSDDTTTEEVRFALVLNGGVSLAVWMGGCAVELDAARRALSVGSGTGSIYGALCRAFRREVVIDVLTGTSAGGINGALLAAAMTGPRGSLDAEYVRDQWLKLGDLDKLRRRLRDGQPDSLLQGEEFTAGLRAVFDHLLIDDDARPSTPPDTCPALDITTTDLAGRDLEFRDEWGGVLKTRDHSVRFRFRKPEDFTPATLTAAARASASFPLAFEPARVNDDQASGIEKLGNMRGWAIDGGILDNAPIRAALELIPNRMPPDRRQVTRFLCYLNGDPEGGATEAPTDLAAPMPPPPEPRAVVGAVLNLPRTAPFADHLRALQDLSRRTQLTGELQSSLLTMDLRDLEQTATALFDVYCKRRRMRALHDRLEPGAASQALHHLEDRGLDLPWIPTRLDTRSDDEWRWGFHASRRVQHLALDVIRDALHSGAPEQRTALMEARARIAQRSAELDARRHGEYGATIQEAFKRIAEGTNVQTAIRMIASAVEDERHGQREAVVDTATDLLAIAPLLGATIDHALFGPAGPVVEARLQVSTTDEGVEQARFGVSVDDGGHADRVDHFIRRVLAIEVVRRSFSDSEEIEDAQKVQFAQLTPQAPDLIFTRKPITETRDATADSKLCGTLFAHFSGFYRRSWRANDFMWGRLDAATRITEMLVSHTRTKALIREGLRPWDDLATDLLAREHHHWLIREALEDTLDRPVEPDELETALRDALKRDLVGPGLLPDRRAGTLTRVIFARAAQFEVLTEELDQLAKEARGDVELGCSKVELPFDGSSLGTPAGARAAVEQLRGSATALLPERLGRPQSAGHGQPNNDEWVSDLGIRTGARLGLVALGFARRAIGGAARPLVPLRALLLPIAGGTSLTLGNRLGLCAAYWAAAVYLAARVLQTDGNLTADLHAVSWKEMALAGITVLVVLGTAAAPFARACFTHDRRERLWQGATAALLVLAGGGVACILALWKGSLTLSKLVVANGTVVPPWWVLVGPLVLAGAFVIVPVGPARMRTSLKRLSSPTWLKRSLAWAFVSSAVLIGWSAYEVWGDIGNDAWRIATACVGLAVAPLYAVLYVIVLPLGLRRWTPGKAARTDDAGAR